MRRMLVLTVLTTLAGCDSKSHVAPTAPTPVPTAPQPAPEVTVVTVTGDNRFTAVNLVRQFTASARMQDGSVRDVTTEAAWSSTDTSVVTVSSRGEVMSVGPGLATILATYTLFDLIDVSVASESASGLSGLYRLAIAAAPECSLLPDWAQRREYDVSIDQTESERPGVPTALTLTAQLEPGVARHFNGSISGSRVSLVFPPGTGTGGGGGGGGGCNDYYYYCARTSAASDQWPYFAHTIDDDKLYALWGQATGSKGSSHEVRISGTVNGAISAANPSTIETLADCSSPNHRFTLTRQ